jgi:hypothetical protein
MFGSCSTEAPQDRHITDGETLRVALEVEKLTNTAATRATIPAEEGETTVESLYLLFFAPDAVQNGTFIDAVEVTEVSEMSAIVDLSAHPEVTATDAYNILAVANLADQRYISLDGELIEVDTWIGKLTGKTQKEVMQQTSAMITVAPGDANAIQPDQLLMSASVEKAAGKSEIDLVLTRGVVRFDIYNEVSATYEIVSTSIWNAYPSTPVWAGAGMVDFSDNAKRTARYYGVENAPKLDENTGTAVPQQNIIGGLYAFENQSAAPEQNDKLTTCVIIGMSNVADGTISYYRANMVPAGSSQMLIRNMVYRLNVTGISGPGHATEEEAYNGRGNNLIYNIGVWSMDDNGLVVQDENSILSIPTKTINMGREGGEFDYSIFISSKLENQGALTVISQNYDPEDGGIEATIDGNILHVEASPLDPSQTERRGIIMLEYAGLRTAINVVQSGEAVTFLDVIQPDGGIPIFQPFGNLSSGLVTVEASGPWTAKIFMDGFSFSEGVVKTTITSADAENGQFRIFTSSANPEDAMRRGFIQVTLDSDPEHYAAVVVVGQKAPGVINIDPDKRVVTFTVDGSLFVPLPPETNVNVFTVLPNLVTGSGGTNYVPEWRAEIIQTGLYDDRDMFDFTIESTSSTSQADNKISVQALAPNFKGRTASAVLRISLTNEPGTFTDITLNQTSFEWDAPADVEGLAGEGATTAELKIEIPAEVTGLHYTVAIQSFSPSTSYGDGDGQQFAYLIDGDDASATPTPYLSLQPNETSVGFKVGFPTMPMSFIDNEIEPEVTVAVTLVETGETKTFTVSQEVMPPRFVNLLNIGTTAWGNFSSSNDDLGDFDWNGTWDYNYQVFLVNNIRQDNAMGVANFGPSGVVPATVRVDGILEDDHWYEVWPTIKEYGSNNWGATWINATYSSSEFYDWAVQDLYDWMNSNDGLLMINAEAGSGDAQDDFAPDGMPGILGLSGGGGINSYNFSPPADEDNKVLNYILDGPFGKVNRAAVSLSSSGTNGYVTQASIDEIDPSHGAISLLSVVATDSSINGMPISTLMIDPSRNLVVKNDSEIFYETLTGDNLIFMKNFLAFCVQTAQYGSVFTNQFWDSPNDVKTMPAAQPE